MDLALNFFLESSEVTGPTNEDKMDKAKITQEFKELFSKMRTGIRSIVVDDHFVTVSTKVRKSAIGVQRDMLLSGAFSSVNAQVAGCGTFYIVHGRIK